MGLMLGKISVETPKYEILAATDDYEIRQYPPAVIAEVTYDPADWNSDKDAGFKLLTDYIGAFGKPKNQKPESIAMTAPVLTKAAQGESIAMTAPVVTKRGGDLVTMAFILPSRYEKAEDAPVPVDERVAIREEGAKKYAAVRFSGVASERVVAAKVEKLKIDLLRDGYVIAGDFVLARYNPPFTLPPLRTNEVMIPV
ncbi:hypothetical protein M569_00369, partial [Genlisea aurea]